MAFPLPIYKKHSGSDEEIPLGSPSEKGEINWKRFFSSPQFIVAVVLLLLTLGILHGVENYVKRFP